MEVYVDSDVDVDCLDFEPDDSDIDADMEPEMVDSMDLATVADTRDQEVMIASIEQSLHIDADKRASEIKFM